MEKNKETRVGYKTLSDLSDVVKESLRLGYENGVAPNLDYMMWANATDLFVEHDIRLSDK